MFQVINADVLVGLRGIASESVQTCVTSPPYFGLRDYGTATWEGGTPDCDHKRVVKPRADRPKNGLHSLGYTDACQQPAYRAVCGKCGAVRFDQQIGLEDTVDAYVARLVAVFREVRRALKADGTCWLNLGDSYGGSSVALKPKDLIGIPWRVAFALQADGWYLRQDIIWHKPNPMPESVRDRCTKAHEYVFLLTKSERYFYDADAVKETASWNGMSGRKNYRPGSGLVDGGMNSGGPQTTRNRRSVWTITPKPYAGAHFAVMPEGLVEPCILAGSRPGDTVLDPFTGSGTVGAVALRHGRRFVGTELNPQYIELANARIAASLPTALAPAA